MSQIKTWSRVAFLPKHSLINLRYGELATLTLLQVSVMQLVVIIFVKKLYLKF